MGDPHRQYHPNDPFASNDLDFDDWNGIRCQCRYSDDFSLLALTDHQNTYTGMRQVDRNTLDVGKGMGMTSWQRLYMIELPLSVSVIMAGIRNALVVAIGITAIGAFVGAGGLGDIIIRGTNATNGASIILAGALPTALMAIITDLGLGFIERRLDPASRSSK